MRGRNARISRIALAFAGLGTAAYAQEANSGFDLQGTVSGLAAYSHQLSAAPRDGGPITGGMRAMFYPTWKLSKNWTISGALEVNSRPYFYDEFSTQGYEAKAQIIQAQLMYSQIREDRSFIFRAGELSSAFGSFLLRYDDAVNPLINMPLSYGYYEAGVTTGGLTGGQVDATLGKLDMRVQLANSSPTNPRSIFDNGQYANWTGGIGYTLAQGFRVGVCAYRGPYLDRQSEYYFPGVSPRDLPAAAYGLEVQWGRGPWNAYAELQEFQFAYNVIPTFRENTGYVELRRVLRPRWYVATRLSYLRSYFAPALQVYETAIGYRPNRMQLIKIGYEIQQSQHIRGTLANVFGIQLVTVFRAISIARD
jgi:hypothetical protein